MDSRSAQRQEENERRWAEIRRRAHGRWTDILLAMGVDEKLLKRKNQPCPLCGGGRDRFRYYNNYGEGTYYCRGCGGGGGAKLLMACMGWKASEARQQLERHLNILPTEGVRAVKPVTRDYEKEFKKAQIRKLVQTSYEITNQDDAGRYLASRGLSMKHYPQSLRFHPAVEYWNYDEQDKAALIGKFPAMLGLMLDQQNDIVAIQRYYLPDGQRPKGLDFRRMLGNGNVGAAVRLGDAVDTLATCEGVENGLAVLIRYGMPVWPAMNAGNLEKLWVPDCVEHLKIYGDNDADSCYDGQASAYVLARRIRKDRAHPRKSVEVFIPKRSGSDWAEVFYQLAKFQRASSEGPTT